MRIFWSHIRIYTSTTIRFVGNVIHTSTTIRFAGNVIHTLTTIRFVGNVIYASTTIRYAVNIIHASTTIRSGNVIHASTTIWVSCQYHSCMYVYYDAIQFVVIDLFVYSKCKRVMRKVFMHYDSCR